MWFLGGHQGTSHFPASFGEGAWWASIHPPPAHLQDSAEHPGVPQPQPHSSWDVVSPPAWGCPLWIAQCVETLLEQQSLRVWDVHLEALTVCRLCSPHRQTNWWVWASWGEAAAVTDELLWCCLAHSRNLFQMVLLCASCLPGVWGSIAACLCAGWLLLDF